MTAPVADGSLVIAVPTRDRVDQLTRLLPLLVRQLIDSGRRGHVLVVDNSDDAGAREVVSATDPQLVRYVHEPVRGLAAVRNRILDEAGDSDWLALIDDDELPSPQWLAELLRVQAEHGCDVVGGAAVLELPDDAPPYLAGSEVFSRLRPRRPSGPHQAPVHTNNALVRVAKVREAGVRFDPAFNRSGGEDTEFFWTLIDRGALVCWADDAVVTEQVHADRLRVRNLLWRQTVRAANFVRIERRHRPAPVAFARQGGRVVRRTLTGVAGLLAGALRLDRGRMLRGAYDVSYGFGTAGGILGIRLRAY